jgi:formylmethanofuran dehydrogenase subunit E
MGPRDPIWGMIREGEFERLLEEGGKVHGHHCPGLALGLRGGAELVRLMEGEHMGMEDVVAIVETNNCFSDGIQFSTGCTFGNNALVYRDYGKTACTLARRDGRGYRISVRPDSSDTLRERSPEWADLFQRLIVERNGTEDDQRRFSELAYETGLKVMGMDPQQLFKVERVEARLPEYAHIYDSCTCERCGEQMMATRAVSVEGIQICIPCAQETYNELNGDGIFQVKPE